MDRFPRQISSVSKSAATKIPPDPVRDQAETSLARNHATGNVGRGRSWRLSRVTAEDCCIMQIAGSFLLSLSFLSPSRETIRCKYSKYSTTCEYFPRRRVVFDVVVSLCCIRVRILKSFLNRLTVRATFRWRSSIRTIIRTRPAGEWSTFWSRPGCTGACN